MEVFINLRTQKSKDGIERIFVHFTFKIDGRYLCGVKNYTMPRELDIFTW